MYQMGEQMRTFITSMDGNVEERIDFKAAHAKIADVLFSDLYGEPNTGDRNVGDEAQEETLRQDIDDAPLAASPVDTVPVGGIDLNPKLLDMQIKRDGQGVPLPVGQQPITTMQIEGFLPIIINVTPVNLPLLLGAAGENNPLNSAQGKESPDDLSALTPYDRKYPFSGT